ncbi:TetR/AcrR family transcriptional regulator [Nakamurella endophytica]|uniref:TetR family transcriptional regulator n=1 Tax=Nakamurella endophytica TaxID=1748367 RepID=A0A917TAQ9_9ACTN|nr:TetR/AcrR family transcriptional regulator [Nakamurella endophytica]GGM16352.1 TetR family transcriptional regulator [Nakamurella endophytica]
MHVEQDAPVGLREAKKQATRRRLTSAARRLAVEHGLDQVTVEMICSEVGVSVRTFFNYFDSKEQSVVGPEMPVGDDATRAAFVAGGPTGRLLDDALELLDPTAAVEDEGRDEFRLAMQLFVTEPRIVALQLARGVAAERDLAALIERRRRGVRIPGQSRGVATRPAVDPTSATLAAVAGTVLRRGLVDWVESGDDRPLTAHLADAARAAAQLFD